MFPLLKQVSNIRTPQQACLQEANKKVRAGHDATAAVLYNQVDASSYTSENVAERQIRCTTRYLDKGNERGWQLEDAARAKDLVNSVVSRYDEISDSQLLLHFAYQATLFCIEVNEPLKKITALCKLSMLTAAAMSGAAVTNTREFIRVELCLSEAQLFYANRTREKMSEKAAGKFKLPALAPSLAKKVKEHRVEAQPEAQPQQTPVEALVPKPRRRRRVIIIK